MIDTKDVIEFFDRCAPGWDADMIRSDEIIGIILDNAWVRPGCDVLDVACGTGVLFPDYLARRVNSVTGIDISPEMIKIARTKTEGTVISTVCGDVEEYSPGRLFDSVVVYNAFPHFTDPALLIEKLAALTKQGGRLTIAHGMSREKIDHHHCGSACRVSNGLMSEKSLAKLFAPYSSSGSASAAFW